MECATCRISEAGDCDKFDSPCSRYKPQRGKLRDWLCDTGETAQEYIARDNKVAPLAIKGARIPLPPPYNKVIGPKEAVILRGIQDVLFAAGIWHVRIDVAGKIIRTAQGACYGKSGMQGMADVLACISGQMVSIEAKASGAAMSPEQNGVLLAQMAAGARACVCVDPSKLLAWLKGGASTATTKTGIPVV